MTRHSPAARPLLSGPELRGALLAPDGLWQDLCVVAETGSTNTDLLAAARQGQAEGSVLVTEAQTAGRGRMGRLWISPPRAALMFSVLLRPGEVPPARRGWLPLLAGVAVARALRAGAAVGATLKWPNDVQIDGEKLAGILAEQTGDAIVVGIGLNVSTRRDELPRPGATSLALAGAALTDRTQVLARVLAELEHWYLAWRGCHGDPDQCGLRPEYRDLCATLGREVRVSLPGGQTVAGTAADVDAAGQLVVRSAAGPVSVSAGDVIHVR